MGLNVLQMKQNNVHTVLWALYALKTSTVKDIALSTGLSFATVGSILGELMETGEVVKGELIADTGGRPSQAYAFHAAYAHVLAVSVQVNKANIVHACIADLYGEVVFDQEQYMEEISLQTMESLVAQCFFAYPSIRAMSFALPGVEHNGILLANDYPLLRGVSFTAHFQAKYQMPVFADNDVNAAVFGYGMQSGLGGVVVGLYFPKLFPPGAGISVDGNILKGARGYAGEVALLPLYTNWISIDYTDPQQAGKAIAQIIGIFCSVVNPGHIVLYGDFFTDAMREGIVRALSMQPARDILPNMVYRTELEADLISGLITQALSAYRNMPHLK